MKGEIDKLMTVCLSKTEEIRKLYEVISEMKSTHLAEKREQEKIIEGLRKKLKEFQEENMEELEILKVKMGRLHQADISSLEQYYENEVASLVSELKELGDQRNYDREKIHQLLQENDELRKNFEIELTKYKAKVQDYKVKFAAANMEFREQITSLGTKMELTSQTLLREAEQKQKGVEFFESEKKKFYAMIEGKDKEISSLYEAMERMKNLHGEEVEQMRGEIKMVKQKLEDKIGEMKEFRKSLEEEFQRKSEKVIADSNVDPDEVLANENTELRTKIEFLEKEIFQKLK